ncbi:MAG: hypothetical protein GTN70_08420, partial [Deltaproteobacteria bacterium]|nr:hypothetical protein [Deltaproteobacteria bacterium]NIS76309.1 hypothetical protein [Deltaproteobacteria bacterium]
MRIKYIISASFLIAVSVATYGAYRFMVKCEGTWEGEPLESKKGISLEEIGVQLKEDIHYMTVVLGERNPERYEELARCAEWIRKRWQSHGYEVKSQVFTLEDKEFENLEIEIPGNVAPSEIIIVSGQY